MRGPRPLPQWGQGPCDGRDGQSCTAADDGQRSIRGLIGKLTQTILESTDDIATLFPRGTRVEMELRDTRRRRPAPIPPPFYLLTGSVELAAPTAPTLSSLVYAIRSVVVCGFCHGARESN